MKKKVLFVCTANSARSQMAEALLKHYASEQYEVFSAGISPEKIDPRAVHSIEKFGLSTIELHAKPIDQFDNESFDYVITLCAKATQECGLPKALGDNTAWDFEDPKTRIGVQPFDLTLKELSERIKMFLLIQGKKEK